MIDHYEPVPPPTAPELTFVDAMLAKNKVTEDIASVGLIAYGTCGAFLGVLARGAEVAGEKTLDVLDSMLTSESKVKGELAVAAASVIIRGLSVYELTGNWLEARKAKQQARSGQ